MVAIAKSRLLAEAKAAALAANLELEAKEKEEADFPPEGERGWSQRLHTSRSGALVGEEAPAETDSKAEAAPAPGPVRVKPKAKAKEAPLPQEAPAPAAQGGEKAGDSACETRVSLCLTNLRARGEVRLSWQ